MVTTDPNKYAKYAMAASKGFSYLVPVTVQAVLVKLLKKLPATARPIYREWYGDLMASRACAQDSANAMAAFVEESFPQIRVDHNELARLINDEIDLDEHSYVPVKFPIVSGEDKSEEDEVEVSQKRRAVCPEPAKASYSQPKRKKTGKTPRVPETPILSTSNSKPELRVTSPSLSLQPPIDHEDSMALLHPTPPPSNFALGDRDEEPLLDLTDVPASVQSATPAVEADVDSSPAAESTYVAPEERETDDEGYSYHTRPPEPFDESLRPHGDWNDDWEFMQALERWM